MRQNFILKGKILFFFCFLQSHYSSSFSFVVRNGWKRQPKKRNIVFDTFPDTINPFIYVRSSTTLCCIYMNGEREVLEGLASNLSSWTCLLYNGGGGGSRFSILLRQLNRNDISLCSPPLAYYVIQRPKRNTTYIRANT